MGKRTNSKARWDFKAPWISDGDRRKINKQSKLILDIRPILQELTHAHRMHPSNIKVATDFNNTVLITRNLFQDMRNTVLGLIVDALENTDTNPVNLWVED